MTFNEYQNKADTHIAHLNSRMEEVYEHLMDAEEKLGNPLDCDRDEMLEHIAEMRRSLDSMLWTVKQFEHETKTTEWAEFEEIEIDD